MQEIPPQIAAAFELQKQGDALIVEVSPNSPAVKAELRRGGIILKYGDIKVEEAAEFLTLVADPAVDEEMILALCRNGKNTTEVTVVIKKLPG